MKKKNIAVITGGDSAEVVISLKSAEQLAGMLDDKLYDIYIIRISGGEWTGTGRIEGTHVDRNDFSITLDNTKLLFDCAFIMIHGTPGENGILQAYFELLRIPYTTCGIYASALTFNKYATKIFLEKFDIPSSFTIKINRQSAVNTDEIIRKTGLPCFVKPNQCGSSFGISKVNEADQLLPAIEKAFNEDDEVLIEEFIDGTELTCGILKTADKEMVFPVTEIVSKTGFFDYKAKYEGHSEEITPARIPDNVADNCRQMTSKIYGLTNCRGIVRVDYIYSNNKLYLLEINTVPGMSAESIIPQQIRAMGMKPEEVFTMVIEDSIKRMYNN